MLQNCSKHAGVETLYTSIMEEQRLTANLQVFSFRGGTPYSNSNRSFALLKLTPPPPVHHCTRNRSSLRFYGVEGPKAGTANKIKEVVNEGYRAYALRVWPICTAASLHWRKHITGGSSLPPHIEQVLFAFCNPKTTKQGLDSPKNGVTLLDSKFAAALLKGKTCIELQHVATFAHLPSMFSCALCQNAGFTIDTV